MIQEPTRPTPLLWPPALAYACNGGLISLPGANFAEFLGASHWSSSVFGLALFVQGVSAYGGTRYLCKALRQSFSPQQSWGVCALLQLVGIALVYGIDQSSAGMALILKFLGFSLIGVSLGTVSLLGSLTGLNHHHPQSSLNRLNLAFTGGAVLIPLLSAGLQSKFTSSAAIVPETLDWRWPLAPVVAALSILLFRGVLGAWHREPISYGKSARDPKGPVPNSPSSASLPLGHRGALWAGCGALFLYVGTEVNLSNSWVLLNKPFSPLAPWASPFYWAGLFMSRLAFSLWIPADQNLARWLIKFAAGTLGALVLLLFVQMSWLPGEMGLVAALLSGLCIGSSYSFILGATTRLTESTHRTHFAQKISEWGVLGAIFLPPLLGFIQESGGHMGNYFFLLLSVALLLGFTSALWIYGKRHATVP